MVVHVQVEVFQVAQEHVALDAVQGPDFFLDLALVSCDKGIFFPRGILLWGHRLALASLGGRRIVRFDSIGGAAISLFAVVVVLTGRGDWRLWQDWQWGRAGRVHHRTAVVFLHSFNLLHKFDLLHGGCRAEQV